MCDIFALTTHELLLNTALEAAGTHLYRKTDLASLAPYMCLIVPPKEESCDRAVHLWLGHGSSIVKLDVMPYGNEAGSYDQWCGVEQQLEDIISRKR